MFQPLMVNLISVTMSVLNEPTASTPAEAFNDNIAFFQHGLQGSVA